jgi:hypothetical protein
MIRHPRGAQAADSRADWLVTIRQSSFAISADPADALELGRRISAN